MFIFTVKARVNPKAESAAEWCEVGGAHVNCYVSFKDRELSEKIAKWAVKDQGWIVEKVTDAFTVQKGKLKTKKEKQYYAEALKFGYCLVFHVWDKNKEI